MVTSEGEQQSVSRLEGEMTDEGHIKQSEEVSVDIPDGADLFTKMDETGVADENKLHDDPVHLDRQKE